MMEHVLSILLISAGIMVVVFAKSFMKKVMGLGIIVNGMHAYLVASAYRQGGVAPILTPGMKLGGFVGSAVDPLPQALILTSIVIDISVTAVLLALYIRAVESGEIP